MGNRNKIGKTSAAKAAGANTSRRSGNRPAGGTRRQSARILLVEDHIALLSLRGAFLSSQGYSVVCAAGGDDALALLGARRFHLVVTDAALPGRSGWEVASAARARNVPVILSSGWPASIAAEELAALGVDFFCPKPCSLNQLQLLVEKALRQSR